MICKLRDLPTWKSCREAVTQGHATPLEEFIYEDEPADHEDVEEWRKRLLKLVNSLDS